MSIIYKYLTIFDENFFCEPTIKISVPEHFNDPFEGATSTISDEVIKLYLRDIYMMNESDVNKYHNITRSYIDYKISSNGIISLSENKSEILMWSHYADNHKGMCIGLDEDFAAHKAEETLQLDNSLLPIPVSYSENRIDISREISIDLFAQDLYMAQVLNKYDKWGYEKEKRVIIPIQLSDRVLIKQSDEVKKIKFHTSKEFEYSISDWVPKILEDKLLIKKEEDGREFYERPENTKVSLFDTFDIFLGKFEEATFLLKIPREKIKEVYFGSKTSRRRIKKMYDQIKNPKNNLEHVKIFKYSLSTDKFELIPTEINDDYFKE